MMKMTSPVHGIVDYLIGFGLILAPWVFGFADFENYSAATWTPVLVGAMLLVLATSTDYEVSLSRLISFKAHLLIETAVGFFLAVSPWLLDFADYSYAPHLVVGLIQVFLAVMTAQSVKKFQRPRNHWVDTQIWTS